VIIATTAQLEGRRIVKYLGLVGAEAIVGGVNLFRNYEEDLRAVREHALEELTQQARERGANAVIGVRLDYEVIPHRPGNVLLVSAYGTAVVCE